MDLHITSPEYRPPAQQELQIHYADEQLIVLDKPAGLLSVPGRGADKQDCLSSRVQRRYPEALNVHRLDMETSGLIIMARNPAMQRSLSRLFEQRRIEKHYMAVVDGYVRQQQGSVDLALVCDWPKRPRQKVDAKHGKAAMTRYHRLQYHAQTNCSVLHLVPITGRTHQLRVHLMSIGHAILGDRLYAPAHVINKAPRLLLHASYLAFEHPASGAVVEIESQAGFLPLYDLPVNPVL